MWTDQRGPDALGQPGSFTDRAEAGSRLAERLAYLRGENLVVTALAPGGVPVACEVARALKAPLDVVLVRTVHAPEQPGEVLGAVGEASVEVCDESLPGPDPGPSPVAGGPRARWRRGRRQAREELTRQESTLRAERAAVPLHGRTVVVVDDGTATEAADRAACLVAMKRGSERTLLAVPAATADAVIGLARDAEVVCLEVVPDQSVVPGCYRRFPPVSDHEALELLRTAPSPQ